MKDEYVYYCPMRPPTLGAVPMNGYPKPLHTIKKKGCVMRPANKGEFVEVEA